MADKGNKHSSWFSARGVIALKISLLFGALICTGFVLSGRVAVACLMYPLVTGIAFTVSYLALYIFRNETSAERLPLRGAAVVGLLLMSIPAALVALVTTRVLIDSPIEGAYRGLRMHPDIGYLFITPVVSCATGAFVFVWLGSRPNPGVRWCSVWILAGLAIAVGAIWWTREAEPMGFVGQTIGALYAAFLLSRSWTSVQHPKHSDNTSSASTAE